MSKEKVHRFLFQELSILYNRAMESKLESTSEIVEQIDSVLDQYNQGLTQLALESKDVKHVELPNNKTDSEQGSDIWSS